MAGYLDRYGVEDARREKIVKRLVVSSILIALVGVIGYFALRSYPAKRKVNTFIEALRVKDYKSAYDLWGCTPQSPCRDYTFEKFMEDWGPQGLYRDSASASIKKTRYCGPGVILTLDVPKSGEVQLWYERKDGNIGFSPWPVCVPQPKAFQ